MNKVISVLLLAIASIAFAAPTVTDVVAKQRYPWGLVDISCKVSGLEGEVKGLAFAVSAIVPNLGITNRLSHICIIKDGEKLTDCAVSANGSYWLLWDAKADLGEVRYTNMVVSVIIDRAMVQLWDGGPYWATTNIGAEEPEEYGYYFWWGDTVGYKRENNKWVASDGSSSNFSFNQSNSPTYDKSTSTLQMEGWITVDGVLAPKHDAAKKHWGSNWRIPTRQEFYDLRNNCDWTWTTMNGVNGYIVRGKGDYSSKSIFLPCAGYGLEASNVQADSCGYYWAAAPVRGDYDFDAQCICLYSSRHYMGGIYRYYGLPVRPLQGFTK